MILLEKNLKSLQTKFLFKSSYKLSYYRKEKFRKNKRCNESNC